MSNSKLNEILKLAIKKGASDIHLKVGVMPVIRQYGVLRPLSSELPALSEEDLNKMVKEVLDEQDQETFLKKYGVDTSYGVSGLGRFRMSIFRQRGSSRIVIRNIPHTVPSFNDLHLPKVVEKIASIERGMILLSGITGSGKSSTLAAIINYINHHKNKHILTIEDPIEFLIQDKKSIITQRELGVDAVNYADSLKAALRQDPDVILIGEMRDRETIETALIAAETGHLVLSTLHALDASETINRIVAAFNSYQQNQIRMQLASVLKAVISQRLVQRKDKKGFVPAVEILINNVRVREMIEDSNKGKDLSQAIEEGQVSWGMQSFDQSLMELLDKKLISLKQALSSSTNPEDLRIRYSGLDTIDSKKWTKNGGEINKQFSHQWNEISELDIEVPTEEE